MKLLFICQDGVQPSGVATYGYSILEEFPEARLLLLNADETPLAATKDIEAQLSLLPTERSHDVQAVAKAIDENVRRMGSGVTILPNTGDTSWAATEKWLSTIDVELRERIRVLGIVHSDMDTQYNLAVQYSRLSPVWVGVSHRCACVLHDRVSEQGVLVFEVPYPISIPKQFRGSVYKGPIRLAYVGRLEEDQKRVSRLPGLFRELMRLECDFEVTLVGDGPERKALEEAVNLKGIDLAGRVSFTGSVGRERINEIWRDNDVCLLVSAYEGLPLTLLESMAAGVCPVVMEMDSGVSDLIVDDECGYVVSQGDVAAMAECIFTLANNRTKVNEYGRAARKRVSDRFSSEKHFSKLESVIAELWNRPAPEVKNVVSNPVSDSVRALVAQAVHADGQIAVYGAGMFGRKVIDECVASGYPMCAWFDSDVSNSGREYNGVTCREPEDVTNFPDAVFVVGSCEFAEEITERIVREFDALRLKHPSIVSLYGRRGAC